MLKLLTIIEYLFICNITLASCLLKSMKNNNHTKLSQHYHGNSTEKELSKMKLLSTEDPPFNNKTSLKMLEDITAKVWRILPVIDIPRNWVLTYCMMRTEIAEEIEKAAMQCQRDGTGWDCTFIELGGGHDDFNMGKVVSPFNNISNRELKTKLLRAAENCSKLWRRYKRIQDRRLSRMGLNIHINNRRRRSSKKSRNRQKSKMNKKNLTKKNGDHNEKMKKARHTIKKIKTVRRKLAYKITKLENKKFLSSEEKSEPGRLHLTEPAKSGIGLQYPLVEEQAELSRLQDIGSCLSRQAAKACESVVLNAIQGLI
ncbi:uncharacterized protein LOC117606968 isoform X1 [Osmia lignaria lignaria]|uniref:uncharacterized protein LOC117606968 isoform X1 n=2 Tax=Osmia lignaria lignaria TaxID=1437193 RepID=UPI00402BB231